MGERGGGGSGRRGRVELHVGQVSSIDTCSKMRNSTIYLSGITALNNLTSDELFL